MQIETHISKNNNARELLSKPAKVNDALKHPIIKRENQEIQEYEAMYKQDFYIVKKQFSQQFSNLYFKRLEALRPVLKAKIASNSKYASAALADNVLSVVSKQPAIVIGTLYKDMKLKPNILLEYTKEVRVVTTLTSCTVR